MTATMKSSPRHDAWYASAATVGFMLIWAMTPVGGLLTRLVGRIDAALVDWAWPLVGLAFFWLCRLGIYLARRRAVQ